MTQSYSILLYFFIAYLQFSHFTAKETQEDQQTPPMSEKVITVLRAYGQSKKLNSNQAYSKESRENPSSDNEAEFNKFRKLHKRTYDENSSEGKKRKKYFIKNLEYIRRRNKENKSFKLGIGPFSDWHIREFREKVLMKPNEIKEIQEEFANSHILSPTNYAEPSFVQIEKTQMKGVTIDWSSYLGATKNQGYCGSCWAFATVGALEANFNIKYNQLYDFSEQYLMDCERNYYGCNGGWQAFTYIANNGISLESYYPYNLTQPIQNDKCLKTDKLKAKVSSTSSCSNCSFDTWTTRLLSGPLMAVMDADSEDFMNYSSGVLTFKPTDCDAINHGVVAYSYTESLVSIPNEDNFTMKVLSFRNSWGSDWGDNGNFHVMRDDSNNSTCFLTKYAYRPEPIIFNNCLIAYQNSNYGGSNYMMCSDEDTSSIPSNGTMSSIRLGKSTQVTLYDQKFCLGKSLNITSDKLSLTTLNFDDLAQSFAFTGATPAGCIRLYKNFCFSGGSIEVCSNVDNLQDIGFNEQISSIRIGSGITKVSLYKQNGYNGETIDITSDAINLNVLGFDRNVNSLKIII